MKFNKIFSVLFVSSLLFAGCTKELPTDSFENVKINNTFLSIPMNGGEVELQVSSSAPWKFIVTETWPRVISFGKNAEGKTIKPKYDYYGTMTNPESDFNLEKTVDSWLKASVMKGEAGETTVKFSAAKSDAGRELKLSLLAGTELQYFTVRQGSLDPEKWTCADIKDHGAVGANYIVENAVITSASSYLPYGKFSFSDDNGKTALDVYGSTKESIENYPSVEAGDVVTISGTWSKYGNFENLEILKLDKSLLKIVTESKTYSKEGEEFEVVLEYKGINVNYSIPEECKDWIEVTGITSKQKEPSKLDPNPANIATVSVKILKNMGGPRSGAIAFSSALTDFESKKESETKMEYTFTQDGNLAKVEDITEEGIYAVVDLTVYAMPNKYTAILSDGTGYVLCNIDDPGHGFELGTTVDFVGEAKLTNGVYQFKNPTVSNKRDGEAPTYPEAVKVTESYLTEYASKPAIVYVSLTGTQSEANVQKGRNINIGSQIVYLSAKNEETEGKKVDAKGFLYGYNPKYSNSSFVALEIKESEGAPTKLTAPANLISTEQTASSLTFTWDAVENANGYQVSLDGGNNWETTQTETTYTWSGLEAGTTYTLYVKAIGDGTAYSDSNAASVSAQTVGGGQTKISDITEAGTYSLTGLTVYAVANASTAIVGDETGFILCYNKSGIGLQVGDKFDISGSVIDFYGIWEFSGATISNTVSGTVTYPEPIEVNEAYLTSYSTKPAIVYVKFAGQQTEDRKILVGSQEVYLSTANSETKGQNVIVTGFFYGYNSKFGQTSLVATSIEAVTPGDEGGEEGGDTPAEDLISKNISEISGAPTDGTAVSTMKFDEVVTLTASSGSNNGKVYSSGAEWRFYQSDNGTLTVTAKNGYSLEKIKVTYTTKNNGILKIGDTTIASDSTVDISGKSVVLTVGNSGTAKNGQAKITAIALKYKAN